ncbi:FMR1-interacting protein NUFIP1-like [Watersipora subatra]|uniref:FMR1-interacting protein NUFIP1-like n=1 Tax=Watersipora subatra TaxID=2589382 RepID=UPI00355B3A9C
MASVTHAPIPSPNLSLKVADSALKRKANPWTELLQERAQCFGIHKHRYSDYDQPLQSITKGCQLPKPSTRHKDNSLCTYYCDACDRGFNISDQYEVHISEHEKCRVKDCPYIAAPKLVKLHYNMQHATGLADKIKESSEDINKWLEERRRNYPTAANVQRKEEERKAKRERGELLETKQFGRMGRGRRGRGRGGRGQRNHRNKYHGNDSMNHSSELQMSSVLRDPDNADPLSPIGAQATKIEPQRSTAVESVVSSSTCSSGNQAANSLGGLSLLLSSYGEPSSEEEGEIREPPQPAKPSVVQSEIRKVPNSDKQEKQVSDAANDSLIRNRKQQWKDKKSSIRSQREHQRKNVSRSKSTLLEKLLANEIRHERNVLLQCVKYVVDEDFFDIGRQIRPVSMETYPDDDEW